MRIFGPLPRASGATCFAIALALGASVRARAQDASAPAALSSCEQSATQLVGRFAPHRFFSHIAYTRDLSSPGLVLLIQKPLNSPASREATLAGTFRPWLEELRAAFEKEIAQPLGLARRADVPCSAVCILASPGDYLNYSRTITSRGAMASWASFDRELGLTTAYFDDLDSNEPYRKRTPLLREYARALLAAHSTPPVNTRLPVLVEEGIASYLAFHLGTPPVSLRARTIDPEMLEGAWDLLQDGDIRDLYFLTFEELAGVRSFDALALALGPRAAKSEFELDLEYARWIVDAQAHLWTHFLLGGPNEQFRAAQRAFAKSALAGHSGVDELRAAFAGIDLRALDVEFQRWILATFLAQHPGYQSAFRPGNEAPGSAAKPTKGAPPAPSLEQELAALVMREEEFEARLGLALRRARRGELQAATVAIDQLASDAKGSELQPRVEREARRLQAFTRLRDAYLRDLAAGGGKLELERDGKKYSLKVKKLDGGVLELDENRLGLRSITAEELDLSEIARAMGKSVADGDDGWARWYPYALAGDERLAKLARDATGEAAALRDDARGAYPDALALGNAADALAGLVEAGVPTNPTSAKIALERVKLLLAAKQQPFVSSRLEPVKRVASAALTASLSESGLEEAIHGKLEPLADGRVRVTYEFDSAREAEDWTRSDSAFAWWHKHDSQQELKETTGFAVREGSFAGRGAVTYRCGLEFAAPLRVSYSIRFAKQGANEPEPGSFMLAVCTTGKEGYVGCAGFGRMEVLDEETGTSDYDEDAPRTPFYTGETYILEVKVADGMATSTLDDAPCSKVPCATRTSGGLAFLAHTGLELELGRVEIEGTLTPACKAALTRTLVERKLAELGF